MQQVVPMIHVPDVRATVDWYQGIGFNVRNTNQPDGDDMDWASMTMGNSEIMLTAGGRANTDERHEVDLYVRTDDVAGLFGRLKDRLELVYGLQDTFYGAREFTVRDLNGLWITFGQQISN